MDKVYLGWALYVAAIAAHMLYWRVAPAALALKRAGAQGWIAGDLYLWLVLSQFALFAWPFVAAGTLMIEYEPRIFSLLLMWFAAVGVAFVISVFGNFIAAPWLNSTKPDVSLKQLGNALTIVAPILTVTCFAFAVFNKPPYATGY